MATELGRCAERRRLEMEYARNCSAGLDLATLLKVFRHFLGALVAGRF